MAQVESVTGTVGYRERIALAPGAVMDVSLLDVSRADASAIVISAQRFAMQGVPTAFELTYDSTLIDPRHSYTVLAKILVQERVVYRSTSAYPVLTRGAPSQVDIMVERAAQAPTVSLEGSRWVITAIGDTPISVERPPQIEFPGEGRVSVFGGCNRFGGNVTLSESAIAFPDAMAGTMMACPEAIAVMERQVLDTLQDVTHFALVGDDLTLKDAAGTSVMHLSRAR